MALSSCEGETLQHASRALTAGACGSNTRGKRTSFLSGCSIAFELGHLSSSLLRRASSTHCSVRREPSDMIELSEGGAIAASLSLRCCSSDTTSDISPEKRESSTDDSSDDHCCRFMSSVLLDSSRWVELT